MYRNAQPIYISDSNHHVLSMLSRTFGDQHMNNMNNTIIRSRLTLYFGLYTPICYLFFAKSTRSTRTNRPNVKTKKIKKSSFSQNTVVRSSPAPFAPRRRPLPLSAFRSRTRENRVWSFRCQSDTFRLEAGHKHKDVGHRHTLSYLLKQSWIPFSYARERFDLYGASAGACISPINISIVGTT